MKIQQTLAMTAIATAAALFFAPAGWTHSNKEKTTPADGAVLESAPEMIRMTFDQPMRITMVRLTDAGGDEVDVSRSDGATPLTEFEARPAALDPGTYSVEWRGLSDDGHPMKGSFSFEIAK